MVALKKISYLKSGVNVDAGDAFADWIQTQTQNKKNNQINSNKNRIKIIEGVGGFASLAKINFKKYKTPCLVTCTDGVGTKVKLASRFKSYSGIGQDLVAMCVNDLICTGADPLLFLDYLAFEKLDLKQSKEILASIQKACIESDLLLVGGETAEMPGVYKAPDFDCAGFAVGVVDEKKRFGSHNVKINDTLIALPSSGFHSNGFSLLRKVFQKDLKKYHKQLLTPTRLYVDVIKKLKENFKLNAVAHITGGGIDNIPRVIPSSMSIEISKWPFPEMFNVVQQRTHLTDLEMMKTLNCGIGMVLIASENESKKILKFLEKNNEHSWVLGKVIKKPKNNSEIIFKHPKLEKNKQ